MKFQDNQVFSDIRLNAMLDYLMAELEAAFPELSPVGQHLLFSGKASAILQGAEPSSIKNVTFQTAKSEFISWMVDVFAKKMDWPIIQYKERLLIYPQSYYFEIWISEEADLHPLVIEEIDVQDINFIPAATL